MILKKEQENDRFKGKFEYTTIERLGEEME